MFVMYPMLPWSGVMALGYAFGAVVALPAEKRRVQSLQCGVVALAMFVVLRVTNWYGDSNEFVHLGSAARTTMSFFDVTKYPPSLQYVCATLGVLLVLFALMDYALEQRWIPGALGVVEVYGRVPFFYYVLHFYLLHVLAIVALMLESAHGACVDRGYGHGQGWAWVVWIAGGVPVCGSAWWRRCICLAGGSRG